MSRWEGGERSGILGTEKEKETVSVPGRERRTYFWLTGQLIALYFPLPSEAMSDETRKG